MSGCSKPLLPEKWQPKYRGTLVYLRRADEVLLIQKLRGHGAGKVNAPGGRVEKDETVVQCARREVAEEIRIEIQDPNLLGFLRFQDLVNGFSLQGFVFTARQFSGEPQETNEAIPFWCKVSEIPYERMWEDDRLWLPHILEEKTVCGDFLFSDDVLNDWYVNVN